MQNMFNRKGFSAAILVLSLVIAPFTEPALADEELAPPATASASIEPTKDLSQSDASLPEVQDSQPRLLSAAASYSDPTDGKLESLTTQIAKKELELIRLNTSFRVECTKVSKWKPWRLFFYNLGASGCSNAGITSITATRWNYWTHPKSMSRTTAATGPILLLIGHCITLGGVLTEASLDAINDYKTRKKGFDIKTTHKRALALKNEIDQLMAQRDALIAQSQDLPGSGIELARAEGAVLKDVRDLSLSEYSQFYVRANKFFGNRDMNSAMAVLAAGTGGFEGSLLGIISAAERQPRLVGPGGIGFLISGATIVATPFATRLTANLRGAHARKKIASEFGTLTTKNVEQFNADRAKLDQLVAGSDGTDRRFANISKRLNAYAQQSTLFTAQNGLNAREKALSDKEFVERVIFAAGIGGTKMSWGINLLHAGFGYHPRSIVQVTKVKGKQQVKVVSDPQPGKLFTRRVAIGATTYLPGTGLWIFDTLQNRIRGEMRNRTLASQKNLPSTLLQERMDRVEEIDGMFNY